MSTLYILNNYNNMFSPEREVYFVKDFNHSITAIWIVQGYHSIPDVFIILCCTVDSSWESNSYWFTTTNSKGLFQSAAESPFNLTYTHCLTISDIAIFKHKILKKSHAAVWGQYF